MSVTPGASPPESEQQAAPADELTPAQVGDLLGLLGKGLRAYQMYQSNNPIYQRFMEGVRDAFAGLWSRVPELAFVVEDGMLFWEGHPFSVGEGRDNLAFQLYKDGVRSIKFLPGFEAELEAFCGVLSRARQLGPEEDDLVTLLWQQEFSAFEYGYVDLLAEGLDLLPQTLEVSLEPLSLELLSSEVGAPGADGAPAPKDPAAFSREDFKETLYFLDPHELDALHVELEAEWKRDMKVEVLNALFDRLEDAIPERQTEILSILRQLLPVFLSRGDFASAATVLGELQSMLERRVLEETHRQEVDRLFTELSQPEVVGQLIQSLQDGAIQPDSEELALFLKCLRPVALPDLLRATEQPMDDVVRERLLWAIDRMAAEYPDHVIQLLEGSEDEAIVLGSARLAGRLRLGKAAGPLIKLLDRADAVGRLTAVDALVSIRSSAALDALQTALTDEAREVRITAVRGLGALKYQPAKGRVRHVIEGRALKQADLTEQLAFFEAYAAVAGADSVELLSELLNGRRFLKWKQPSELRACAATALGSVGTPAARHALEMAAEEADPVVRAAVHRALRQEGAAR